jgi:hypothetical protein
MIQFLFRKWILILYFNFTDINLCLAIRYFRFAINYFNFNFSFQTISLKINFCTYVSFGHILGFQVILNLNLILTLNFNFRFKFG